LGDALVHLSEHRGVEIDRIHLPAHFYDGPHVDELIKDRDGCRPMLAALKQLHPELRSQLAQPRYLPQFPEVQRFAGHFFRHGNRILNLPLDKRNRVIGNHRVDKRSINQDERHSKVVGQHPVPMEDGLADVCARGNLPTGVLPDSMAPISVRAYEQMSRE